MRDERRFLGRRARRAIGSAAAVGLLAASGALVGVGLASSPRVALDTTATTVPATGKVAICHKTHSKKNPGVTISINVHAWPAHLRHGDTLGACLRPTTASTGTTTGSAAPIAAPVDSGPGHSGEHGQGNGPGNHPGNGPGNGRGHNR